MEFNAPLDSVRFAQPEPPKPDFAFPAGRAVRRGAVRGAQRARLPQGDASTAAGPCACCSTPAATTCCCPGAAQLGAEREGAPARLRRRSGAWRRARRHRRRRSRAPGLRDHRPRGLPAPRRGPDGHRRRHRLRAPAPLSGQARLRALARDPLRPGDGSSTRAAARAVPIVFRGTTGSQYAGRSTASPACSRSTPAAAARSRSPNPSSPTTASSQSTTRKSRPMYGASVAGPMRATLARVNVARARRRHASTSPVTMLSLRDPGALADAELAGNIGNGILRRFNVTFDFPRATSCTSSRTRTSASRSPRPRRAVARARPERASRSSTSWRAGRPLPRASRPAT